METIKRIGFYIKRSDMKFFLLFLISFNIEAKDIKPYTIQVKISKYLSGQFRLKGTVTSSITNQKQAFKLIKNAAKQHHLHISLFQDGINPNTKLRLDAIGNSKIINSFFNKIK